jgi:hypothetical protein
MPTYEHHLADRVNSGSMLDTNTVGWSIATELDSRKPSTPMCRYMV